MDLRLQKNAKGEELNFSMPVDCSGVTLLEAVVSEKQDSSLITKKDSVKTAKLIEQELKYLRDLILQLEKRQLAESIKCVIDHGKDPSDGI